MASDISTLPTGIGAKLMLVLTASLAISTAAIGFIGYRQQVSLNQGAVDSALHRRFDTVASAFRQRGLIAEATAISVANNPAVGEALAHKDRPALLAAMKDNFSQIKQTLGIDTWTFHNTEGVAIARMHAPDKFGDNVTARRHLVEDVLKTGEVKFGIEPGLSTLAIFATVPTRYQGAIVGLTDLGAAIDTGFLTSLKASSHADIALHLSRDATFQTIGATFEEKTLLAPEDLHNAMSGMLPMKSSVLGSRPVAILAGPLKSYSGTPIGVIEVSMDVSDYASLLNQSLIYLAGSVALVTLIGIIVSWLMSRNLSGPIGQLNSVMLTLAGGQYNLPVPGQERHDEIGTMARSVETLRQGALERERLAEEKQIDQERRILRGTRREELIEQFSTTIKTMVESVNSHVSTMETNARQMSQMASSTTQFTSSADQASRQSSQNVQSVATASEELAASSVDIAARIGETNAIVSRANAEAVDANKRIKSLAEASTKIGDVVSLIRSIAGQTNLLALNATIEAARAGEAGRGFAVVASEVKALADQTAKATDEIARQIVSVQHETGTAVESIESIANTMSSVAQYAEAVSTAVEQQRQATAEISRNVQSVATGTGTVVETIGSVTETAAKTTQSASSILHSTFELSQQSGMLGETINSFLEEIRSL